MSSSSSIPSLDLNDEWQAANQALAETDRAQQTMRDLIQLDREWGQWYLGQARRLWMSMRPGTVPVCPMNHRCGLGDSCQPQRVTIRVFIHRPYTKSSILGAHICMYEHDTRQWICGDHRYQHDPQLAELEWNDLYFCTISGNFHLCGRYCNSAVSGGAKTEYRYVCQWSKNVLDLEQGAEVVSDIFWKGHSNQQHHQQPQQLAADVTQAGESLTVCGPSYLYSTTTAAALEADKSSGNYYKWMSDMVSIETWSELEQFTKLIYLSSAGSSSSSSGYASSSSIYDKNGRDWENTPCSTDEKIVRYIITRIYVLFVKERHQELTNVVNGNIMQLRCRMARLTTHKRRPQILSLLRMQFDPRATSQHVYTVDWVAARRAMVTLRSQMSMQHQQDRMAAISSLAHKVLLLYKIVLQFTQLGRDNPECFPLQSFCYAGLSLLSDGISNPDGTVLLPVESEASVHLCNSFAQQTIPREIYKLDYVQTTRHNIVSALVRGTQNEGLPSNIFTKHAQEFPDPSTIDLKVITGRLPHIYYKSRPRKLDPAQIVQ